MSETHWRNYAAVTVAKRIDDPDHVPGAVRWRADGMRALMRFRGPPLAKTHLTPAEAREMVRSIHWRTLPDTEAL